MKVSLAAAVCVCALFAMAAPAAAFSTANVPPIHLISLSPPQLGVSSARSGCFADAAVDGTAFWEKPVVAEQQGINGTVAVQIDLTSTGSLAYEKVSSSSGNSLLDGAAMRSARLTRFTPETAGCRHVGGSYLYVVDY